MSAAIPMFSTPTQNVLERLHRVQKTASGWQAYCPHHEPANERHEPSLSVAEGRKGCVVTCHRGCTQEEVVAAIGFGLMSYQVLDVPHVAPILLAAWYVNRGFGVHLLEGTLSPRIFAEYALMALLCVLLIASALISR